MIYHLNYKAIINGLVGGIIFSICFGIVMGGALLLFGSVFSMNLDEKFESSIFSIFLGTLSLLNYFISAAVGSYICLTMCDESYQENTIAFSAFAALLVLLSQVSNDDGVSLFFLVNVVIISSAVYCAFLFFKKNKLPLREGIKQ